MPSRHLQISIITTTLMRQCGSGISANRESHRISCSLKQIEPSVSRSERSRRAKGGDYNVIRFVSEKNNNLKLTKAMQDFSKFISDWELIDLPLIMGNPGFIFNRKLRNNKDKLRLWNKNSFERVDKRMENLLQMIQVIDVKEHQGTISDEDRNSRVDHQNSYAKLTRLEGIKWNQKIKDQWVADGERNTAYYHVYANQRRRCNFISCMKIDGEISDNLKVVGLWRGICNKLYISKKGLKYKVGTGTQIRFWTDFWIGDRPLAESCPLLFGSTRQPNAMVSNVIQQDDNGMTSWNLDLSHRIQGEEVEEITLLTSLLDGVSLTSEADSRSWALEKNISLEAAAFCYVLATVAGKKFKDLSRGRTEHYSDYLGY
ncbi:hypothetical protein BVC80_8597g11 [Macleaya cordata]|uniref:Uncharacterized protein n=1 Tax=Macleaya cordata TaxID=56857 RepID=A0A200PNV4_MACCD|nr:hypothetical protein BVC80_8597g11 [Macleaya cordata]